MPGEEWPARCRGSMPPGRALLGRIRGESAATPGRLGGKVARHRTRTPRARFERMFAEELLDTSIDDIGPLERGVMRRAGKHAELRIRDLFCHLLRDRGRREKVSLSGDD